MTKTLTEQWKDGELPQETFYWKKGKEYWTASEYEMRDYLDVRDIRDIHCIAPVPSYEEYKELVSKTDELVQKVHILNEQNTKQYNELCEEIKKNNILEKQLVIATKALKKMAKDNFQCAEQALEEIELREVK